MSPQPAITTLPGTAPLRLRAAGRAAAGLACLAAAVGLARLCAAAVPDVGLAIGVAVALGVPGLALARLTGLTRVLEPAELLALVPVTGLAAWAAPLAIALAVHLAFRWPLAVVLAGSAVVLGATARPPRRVPAGLLAGLAAGGTAAALVASRWEPSLTGDALYHAGVIRKLLDLGGISIGGVSPYLHGHAHAGYAFPLLHAVEAAAVWIAGLEPSAAYPRLATAFAALVPVVAYGAGRALASPTVGVIAAVLATWDAATRLVIELVQEPPFFAFAILLPAGLVILARLHRDPGNRRWVAWSAVLAGEVALVHPTYAPVVLALVAAVVLLDRRAAPALAAAVGVTATVAGWILWVALRGGEPRTPTAAAPGQLATVAGHAIASSGQAILAHRVELVPALVATAVVLWRRRPDAALPGALVAAGLALVAVPGAAAVTVAAVGAGQAERFWNAIPWPFATGVAIVLLAARLRTRRALLVAAALLAAGSLAAERADVVWGSGGPHAPGWPQATLHPLVGGLTLPDLAVMAVAVALAAMLVRAAVAGGIRPRPAPAHAPGALAAGLLLAALMLGPVARNGPRVAHRLVDGSPVGVAQNSLSPGVVAFFRAHDGAPFPVVLAPYAQPNDGLAYQLVGLSTVYTVAVSEPHSRATPRDRPRMRRRVVARFFDPATPEAVRRRIMARFAVRYVVVDLRSASAASLPALRRDPSLTVVYADGPGVASGRARCVVLARRTPRGDG